jgi:hypothetical protein
MYTFTSFLNSIFSNIVMGCIVLGRQMNVDFATSGCTNAIAFVGMDVRFCTMKIHDSIIPFIQTRPSIVVHLAVVQSCFCICTITVHSITTIFHKFTLCCCNSGTTTHPHPSTPTLFDNTLQHVNSGLTPLQLQTIPILMGIRDSQFFKFNILLVRHSKPTPYRRLSFAFANKGNVAAGDIFVSVLIPHDFVNPLLKLYFQGIIRRVFFSLRKDPRQVHRFLHGGAPLRHANNVLRHHIPPILLKKRVAAAQD